MRTERRLRAPLFLSARPNVRTRSTRCKPLYALGVVLVTLALSCPLRGVRGLTRPFPAASLPLPMRLSLSETLPDDCRTVGTPTYCRRLTFPEGLSGERSHVPYRVSRAWDLYQSRA